MLKLIAFRIAQAIPVMLVVAVLTFLLMHLLPGDPATIIAGMARTTKSLGTRRIRRRSTRSAATSGWTGRFRCSSGTGSSIWRRAISDAR